MIRVNVGCGATPTPGFINLDNSWTVRLAPWLRFAVPLLDDQQRAFALKARAQRIRWAQATRLPLAAGSADVVYSSHMFEHLDHAERALFLGEALRVLAPGGILRLVVPDLARIAAQYATDGDADHFVEATLLAKAKPLSLWRALLVGDRHHAWMYDGRSLSRLLADHGFLGPGVLAPGETTIADPGALDLCERADESVYVEARKP